MSVVASPDLERSLGTAHATLAIIIFLVPGAIAFVVEPWLFLLADRRPRRWFVRGGVAGMMAAAFVAAVAPGPIVLALAFGAGGIASGISCSLAQATLVDAAGDARGRTLARWTLVSVIGDLAAPALLAALAYAGLGWRTAYALVGSALLVWLLALCIAYDDDNPTAREDSPPLRSVLRDALRDRTLIAWLFGTELCALLDEVLVVFASLHVRLDLGASVFWQTGTIAVFMIGDALGLIGIERLLRARSERSLLVIAAAGCAIAYGAWLASPTALVALVLALPVGVFTAPLYPLTAAQAYATRPSQSGSVLAIGHLFMPLSLALPWLIGTVADRAGTVAALALLVAQPLGLIALVAATARRSSAASDRSSRSTRARPGRGDG